MGKCFAMDGDLENAKLLHERASSALVENGSINK